jgi:diphthamide biosynthesis enzyme Dph1/Dph2-like protein
MEIDLEIEKAVEASKRARIVCIQLPDGLKPKALEIHDAISKGTKAEVLIWAGSCYGACDTPELTGLGVDLLIQWGHSRWE